MSLTSVAKVLSKRDKEPVEDIAPWLEEVLEECQELIFEGESDEAELYWESSTGLEIDYLIEALF